VLEVTVAGLSEAGVEVVVPADVELVPVSVFDAEFPVEAGAVETGAAAA